MRVESGAHIGESADCLEKRELGRSLWARVSVVALAAVAMTACSDGASTESPSQSSTTTEARPDATSINRSGLPSGAAPGDGSGAGKTPEGNSNSGESPPTLVAR